MWEIPYGLGSYSNPVEQPNSAWPTDPETPESYTTPSQSYVDDLDAFFYGYDNSDLYETGLQEYGEITVTNASGSASFSSAVDFYEDFRNDELGNEGQGSALTEGEKQTIVEAVAVTYNTSNVSAQSNSSSSRLSWWDLTCAYAAGFGSGLLQGGRNIANGVIGTVEEIKNTAIDVGHGTITAASLLVCDEPIVYEAQSQALRALESNQISTSRFYWRFGETVLTFGTNEQVRAAIQWWKGEITDDECSEIIGSTAFAQLIIARSGNAMGKGKPAPKPERPAGYIIPSHETVSTVTTPNFATGFRGSRGFPLTRSLVQERRNQRQLVNGRYYSGHVLDQLQDRGIMPSVVETAIQHGRKIPDSTANVFIDDINRIKVVVNRDGEVIKIITLQGGCNETTNQGRSE